jgi:hypothetical protein
MAGSTTLCRCLAWTGVSASARYQSPHAFVDPLFRLLSHPTMDHPSMCGRSCYKIRVVGFGSMRSLRSGIAGMISALCTAHSLFAPEKAVAVPAQGTAVSVPFIGCKSDGQAGPSDAPEGKGISVRLSVRAAKELAYYRSSQSVSVLAPRGWYCFGTYGSGGDALFVSSQPIDTTNMFSTQSRFAGPAIVISHRFGDTSGRFDVAAIIARVFPAYKAFVTGAAEIFDLPASTFSFGPYPKDTLTYKSKAVVEYRTPAQADGLGTHSLLKKNDSPIDGVAILIGRTPDLLLLSVRLPRDLKGLTSAIVGQFERDAARFPSN